MHVNTIHRFAPVLGCAACSILLLGTGLASSQTGAAQDQPQSKAQHGTEQTTKITIAELTKNPEKYRDQQVTIEADVHEVLGPRLLTIERAQQAQARGGDHETVLVFLHAPYAGLVNSRSHVTITGIVRPVVQAEIERELRWIDANTASVQVGFERLPMIVARSIRSDEGMELTMNIGAPAASGTTPTVARRGEGESAKPAGTAGSGGTVAPGTMRDTARPAIEDVSQLTTATNESLVGRSVMLSKVRVARAADKQSFWVSDAQGRDNLLVLPVQPSSVAVTEGDMVTIEGVVLEMPAAWRDKFSTIQGSDERVYVFASSVRSVR